jgi:hypothetical protein
MGYFLKVPGSGTVVISDLVFVYHGLAMVLIMVVQSLIYKVNLNII